MLCPKCNHEVPPAPPLADDFEFAASYLEAQAAWQQAQGGRTREWGYCECVRCVTCWDILHATKPCHCGKTLQPPPAPPEQTAGVLDGLPDNPHRVP